MWTDQTHPAFQFGVAARGQRDQQTPLRRNSRSAAAPRSEHRPRWRDNRSTPTATPAPTADKPSPPRAPTGSPDRSGRPSIRRRARPTGCPTHREYPARRDRPDAARRTRISAARCADAAPCRSQRAPRRSPDGAPWPDRRGSGADQRDLREPGPDLRARTAPPATRRPPRGCCVPVSGSTAPCWPVRRRSPDRSHIPGRRSPRSSTPPPGRRPRGSAARRCPPDVNPESSNTTVPQQDSSCRSHWDRRTPSDPACNSSSACAQDRKSRRPKCRTYT